MASTKGSAPSATTPEPGRRTVSSQGMALSALGASAALTSCAVPHPTSVEPGAVEEDRRAPVELERIGPVLQGDTSGVRAASVTPAAGAGGDYELAQASRQGSDPDGGEAGLEQHPAQDGGGGEVGHRAGEVLVGLPVGEGAAQGGDGPVEPHVVPGTPEPGRRGIDFEHGETPAGAQDAGALRERGPQVGEVTQRVAAHEAVEGAVEEGESAAVGLDERCGRGVGRQHARAQVRPDPAVAAASRQPGEVARPTGQVEDERALGQGE